MTASVTQVFGTNASVDTTASTLTVNGADFTDVLPAGARTVANAKALFNATDDGERAFVALVLFNAARNYNKADGTENETFSVVVSKSFGGTSLVERNGGSQYKRSYTIDIYTPAGTIATDPDPRDIA